VKGGKPQLIVTIPNLLTLFRLCCGLSLIFVPPLGPLFLTIYTVGGVTDALDGYLARRLNQTSPWGARLDSAADLTLYIVVLLRLVPILRQWLPSPFMYIIGGTVLLRLSCYIVAALKFRRFASEHTRLNKATSFLVFLVPYVLLLDIFPVYAGVVCAVGAASSLQELCIHIRRPAPPRSEEP
jgi:CDP-diacylglycerol--glycerol-3-phosphate 3-phosphatidyltransferase